MTPFSALRADPEFEALRHISAALGADPAQVQAAGGNTSLKRDGAMWIKASGTWLADALTRDIFVPVDLTGLRAAIAAGDPGAESAVAHVPAEENPGGLRPSIETTVHAALDAPVVIHTHCVATIALAIRQEGAALTERLLADLGVVWIPYVKPGLRLAREIMSRAGPDARALVLGRHGLVAAGETVVEAEALLRAISARLTRAPLPPLPPAPALADGLRGSAYTPASSDRIHAMAMDPTRLTLAASPPWCPDQVIFLGPAIPVCGPGETPDACAARHQAQTGAPPPPLVLLPGLGAAIRADASPAAHALALGLADFLAQVEPDAELIGLGPDQVAELLDWDAEKYRQTLDQTR
jgi:rhamnose utilization protein RhaD (predicted bifunctional aldolase and dehydrogenase)